mmetsp:Transcript_8618/g.24526  ORF Transcript_8618/g.24526 Transcript_8618/m.24526 type:complete len:216 (+) Transcript_8618:2670-3317(+)
MRSLAASKIASYRSSNATAAWGTSALSAEAKYSGALRRTVIDSRRVVVTGKAITVITTPGATTRTLEFPVSQAQLTTSVETVSSRYTRSRSAAPGRRATAARSTTAGPRRSWKTRKSWTSSPITCRRSRPSGFSTAPPAVGCASPTTAVPTARRLAGLIRAGCGSASRCITSVTGRSGSTTTRLTAGCVSTTMAAPTHRPRAKRLIRAGSGSASS